MHLLSLVRGEANNQLLCDGWQSWPADQGLTLIPPKQKAPLACLHFSTGSVAKDIQAL